jgi:hypothetical protein
VTAADSSNPASGGEQTDGSASPITVEGLTDGDSYTFTVTATNSIGTGPASAPSDAIQPAALPVAIVKSAYTVTLSASGGTSPYAWKLTSGALPGGLSLSGTKGTISGALPAGLSLSGSKGTISGTPTKAGTFTFTVEVTDSGHPGLTATKTYSLVVKPDRRERRNGTQYVVQQSPD